MGGGIRSVSGTCQLRTWGRGAGEGHPRPIWAAGAGPSPQPGVAGGRGAAGPPWRRQVSHHRGTQRAAAWAAARADRLYFYTLNKTPDNKPKPRPPHFPSPRGRGRACAAAGRESRMRGAGAEWPWRRRRRCGPRRRPCGGSNRTRPIPTRCEAPLFLRVGGREQQNELGAARWKGRGMSTGAPAGRGWRRRTRAEQCRAGGRLLGRGCGTGSAGVWGSLRWGRRQWEKGCRQGWECGAGKAEGDSWRELVMPVLD